LLPSFVRDGKSCQTFLFLSYNIKKGKTFLCDWVKLYRLDNGKHLLRLVRSKIAEEEKNGLVRSKIAEEEKNGLT